MGFKYLIKWQCHPFQKVTKMILLTKTFTKLKDFMIETLKVKLIEIEKNVKDWSTSLWGRSWELVVVQDECRMHAF